MAVEPTSTPAAPQTTNGAARLFFTVRRAFIAYARWLDSITWVRFFVLSLLAIIVTAMLSELPPFSWKWTGDVEVYDPPKPHKTPKAPKSPPAVPSIPGLPTPPTPPAPPEKKTGKKPVYNIEIDKSGVHITPNPDNGENDGVPSVSIDKNGVRIGAGRAAAAASAASAPSSAASASDEPQVTVKLPPNANTEEVRAAIEEAKQAIKEAIADAAEEEADAARAAAEVAAEAAVQAAEDNQPRKRVISGFRPGDHMPGLMMLWIVMSMVVKIMAAGRFKAEAQAVQATEIAESEALKRQVVEARMAAMQAQVEPHFLFNTLASIDHLIETDPPRASKMQKNLIALLRASMPTMREANAQGTRDLGRELAVIRPYLEILKVRMEERLQTEINVPEGLQSADFPPMMLQGLVENAIKHGLEPKAEGGRLTVTGEIVHGKLCVTVADTGLGFGKAATSGTGIGLNNIRERLQLLYGRKATLVVSENPGGGTAVSITVPYTTSSHRGEDA
jgi:signal transduction histidine kinase